MSEKSKINRAARQAKQERQAKKVVYWIFGTLIAFAIAFMIYSMVS